MFNIHRTTLFVIFLVITALVGLLIWFKSVKAPTQLPIPSNSQNNSKVSILDKSRITKKPFRIYITPVNSPVQPEKFTGYHTGLDFETTPAEANIDVPVPAICNGKLLLKKYATDYGGVAVQSCVLNNQSVTIVYGHLKLISITTLVGQVINEGNTIGILGKGYSTETDDERKHLHLAVHKGTAVNILGYVQRQSDLSVWLDPANYLP